MAKQFHVPSVDKVEEVLDLILNPDKYIKYMQDLVDLQRAIQNELGLLRTREEADRVLADAYDVSEKTQRYAKDVELSANKLKADAQAEYDKSVQLHMETEKRYNAWESDLTTKDLALRTGQRLLDEATTEFVNNKQGLIDQYNKEEAALNVRAASVAKKEAMLESAFKALGM